MAKAARGVDESDRYARRLEERARRIAGRVGPTCDLGEFYVLLLGETEAGGRVTHISNLTRPDLLRHLLEVAKGITERMIEVPSLRPTLPPNGIPHKYKLCGVGQFATITSARADVAAVVAILIGHGECGLDTDSDELVMPALILRHDVNFYFRGFFGQTIEEVMGAHAAAIVTALQRVKITDLGAVVAKELLERAAAAAKSISLRYLGESL